MNTTLPAATDDFIISREFAAPRELLWRAWTEPTQLARWWGPRIMTTPVCEMDVRPGGAYRIVMRSPDGTDYPIRGVFLEVAPPGRLVLTMDCTEHPPAWHQLVKPGCAPGENPAGVLLTTVTFEEIGRKTVLTIQSRFDSPAIADAMRKMGMNDGWSQSLDRLHELLAGSEPTSPSPSPMELNTGKLKVALPDDCSIRLIREFAAPRQLVFGANTKPAMLKRWLFGPEGWSMAVCDIDLRVGGKYRYVWRHKDGQEFATGGKFLQITSPDKIVSSERFEGAMDHGEAINTLEFSGPDGKTTVTLTMRFPSKAVRDGAIKSGMNQGIELGYARLDDIFATPASRKGSKRS